MKRIARVAELYLAMIGSVVCVAWLSSMQWWIDAIAGGFGLLGFFLLYKFVAGIERRQIAKRYSDLAESSRNW